MQADVVLGIGKRAILALLLVQMNAGRRASGLSHLGGVAGRVVRGVSRRAYN